MDANGHVHGVKALTQNAGNAGGRSLAPLRISSEEFKPNLGDFSQSDLKQISQKSLSKETVSQLVDTVYGGKESFEKFKLFKNILHELTHEMLPNEVFNRSSQSISREEEDFVINFTYSIMAGEEFSAYSGKGWSYVREGKTSYSHRESPNNHYRSSSDRHANYSGSYNNRHVSFSKTCSDLSSFLGNETNIDRNGIDGKSTSPYSRCSSAINPDRSVRTFQNLKYYFTEQRNGLLSELGESVLNQEFDRVCQKINYAESVLVYYNASDAAHFGCWNKSIPQDNFISSDSKDMPLVKEMKPIVERGFGFDVMTIYNPLVKAGQYTMPILYKDNQHSMDQFCRYFSYAKAISYTPSKRKWAWVGFYFSETGEEELVYQKERRDSEHKIISQPALGSITCSRD